MIPFELVLYHLKVYAHTFIYAKNVFSLYHNFLLGAQCMMTIGIDVEIQPNDIWSFV